MPIIKAVREPQHGQTSPDRFPGTAAFRASLVAGNPAPGRIIDIPFSGRIVTNPKASHVGNTAGADYTIWRDSGQDPQRTGDQLFRSGDSRQRAASFFGTTTKKTVMESNVSILPGSLHAVQGSEFSVVGTGFGERPATRGSIIGDTYYPKDKDAREPVTQIRSTEPFSTIPDNLHEIAAGLGIQEKEPINGPLYNPFRFRSDALSQPAVSRIVNRETGEPHPFGGPTVAGAGIGRRGGPRGGAA